MLNMKLVHYTRILLLASTTTEPPRGQRLAGQGLPPGWQSPRGWSQGFVGWVFLVSTARGDSKAIVQPAWPLVLQTSLPTERHPAEVTAHVMRGSKRVFARILNTARVWKLPTEEIKRRNAVIRLMH